MLAIFCVLVVCALAKEQYGLPEPVQYPPVEPQYPPPQPQPVYAPEPQPVQYGPQPTYDQVAQLPPLNMNYPPSATYRRPQRESSSSESDEHRHGRGCQNCDEIRKSCRDYNGQLECFKPEINYLSKNCSRAIVSCTRRHSIGPFTLETARGETLFHGFGFDQYVSCTRHGRWEGRDNRNEDVEFRSLRCLGPQRPGYAPPVAGGY